MNAIPPPWHHQQAPTWTLLSHRHHGTNKRQQQQQQINNSRTPSHSQPPHLQGGPLGRPIASTLFLLPIPLLQWQQWAQSRSQTIPHHSSPLTQALAHLSLQHQVFLGLGLLSCLLLQSHALTQPSPPSLPPTLALHLASTPQATPTVVLHHIQLLTVMGGTVTQLGHPIPVPSHHQGGPSTDQDMEFLSRTPEGAAAAPLHQFFLSFLSQSPMPPSPFSSLFLQLLTCFLLSLMFLLHRSHALLNFVALFDYMNINQLSHTSLRLLHYI